MKDFRNSISRGAARKSTLRVFALAFIMFSLIITGMPLGGSGEAFAADEADGPQAYAVYTADDQTLTFLMRDTAPAEGEMLGEHEITYVCQMDDTSAVAPEYQSEAFRFDVKTAVFDATLKDWHPLTTYDMFYNFNSLEYINGIENLNTDKTVWTSGMFCKAYSLKSIDLSGLDLSKVRLANSMFSQCRSLEEIDMPVMDSGNLIDTAGMFYDCPKLTEIDLSGWDTSNVTDMNSMFGYSKMDIKGLGDLDTSKVTNMAGMFRSYTGPALDLKGWNTSEVTDMSNMFCSCTSSVDIAGIDTSKVSTMREMFYAYGGPELHVIDLENNSVTDMHGMFTNCYNLSELDLTGFKTTSVCDMSKMFSSSHMDLDLSGFSTSKVTDMSSMFGGYRGKKLDLSGFHINTGTKGVEDLLSLYCDSLEELVTPKAIEEDVEISLSRYLADEEHTPYRKLNGDTPRQTKLTAANIQQIDISDNEDVSVTPANGKEYRHTGDSILPEVSVEYKGEELTKGVDYKVKYENTIAVSTQDKPGLIIIEGKDLYKGTIVRTFSIIPADQIPHGETDPEADKPGRFYAVYTKGNRTLTFLRAEDRPPRDGSLGDEPITEVFVLNASDVYDIEDGKMPPWSKYRTSVEKVVFDQTMGAMEGESAESGRAEPVRPVSLAGWFSDFSRLKRIEGLENLDTSKVTDMNHMLYFCNELKSADVSSFDTSNVKDMSYMFGNCEELENINVSGFDTSKVTDMSGMFRWCQSVDMIDVSRFNTSNVKSMKEMFYCCTELDGIDLSNFKTAGVTDFDRFLYGCADTESLDLRSVDLSGAADENATEKMLKACVRLKEIYTPKVGKAGVELSTELFDKNHNGYTKITNKIPAGTYLCVGYGRAKSLASKSVIVKIAGKEFKYTGSEIRPAVTVTCEGNKLAAGRDYKVAYSKNKNIGAARVIVTGCGNYEGSVTKTFSIVPETFIKGKIKYEITNPAKGEVTVVDIRKNSRVITIPGSIKYKGRTYRTRKVILYSSLKNKGSVSKELKLNGSYIDAGNVGSFPNLTKVILGKQVQTIGAGTFKNKKKLKKIVFKGKKVRSIGGSAFKRINSKAVFHTPKSVLSKYKKKIKKAGAPKKAKYKAL